MTPADVAPYYSEKLFILPVPFYVTSYKADAERQNHLIQDRNSNSKLSSKDFKTVAPVKYPTVSGMLNYFAFFLCHPVAVTAVSPVSPTREPCRARCGQRRHASFPQLVAAQYGDGKFQSGQYTLCFSVFYAQINVEIFVGRCLMMVPAPQDWNVVLVFCRADFSRMSQLCSVDHGKVPRFKRVVAFEKFVLQLSRSVMRRVLHFLSFV